jgi:hypothetical protein
MALADVHILPTGFHSPAQLAIHLDQLAKNKTNPVTGALLLTFDSNGKPNIAVANLEAADLFELRKYLDIILDNSYRKEWGQELSHGPEDESG